jgi:hypothetical protein
MKEIIMRDTNWTNGPEKKKVITLDESVEETTAEVFTDEDKELLAFFHIKA